MCGRCSRANEIAFLDGTFVVSLSDGIDVPDSRLKEPPYNVVPTPDTVTPRAAPETGKRRWRAARLRLHQVLTDPPPEA